MSAIAEVPASLLWSNITDILFFNVLGVMVCLYALHVEVNKERNPSYKAMCDINEHMSCSRVLTSQYSQGFGVMHLLFGKNHMLNSRNCNIGLVVFIAQMIICIFLPSAIASTIMFYSAVAGVLGSIYLAFILFFILKDLCLVCITTYIINGCLLYLTHSIFLPSAIASTIMFYSAVAGVLGSIYLAFILFFILKDLCLVCITTYIINGCLLYLTHSMYHFYHA